MIVRTTEEFSYLVFNRRKALGLTQAQVAERAGLTQKVISMFENHPEKAMLTTALRILAAVDTNLFSQPKNQKSQSSEAWPEEW